MADHTESRRSFLKKLGLAAGGIAVAGAGLDIAFERHWVEVTRPRIAVPGLPAAFDGIRICQLTDVHHGPYLAIERVHDAVSLAQEQRPDLFVITGDLSHKREWSVPPVWDAMSPLQAPLGVWGVMGNHDWWHGIAASREGAKRAQIGMLDNRAVPIVHRGERLWLAGVGDLWTDRQDLAGALRGVPDDEPVILLTHNPDYADEMADRRVKLMLAGHSHGGQICPPLMGPLKVPNRMKYAAGLVRTAVSQVYISRGIGMAILPFRFNCRPELPVFELARA
ncbi:MAG: metallophosphoesterase [Armatimonadota bacterium]|jgi:predicted MPP superfamily phosphohydrolase